MEAATGVNFGTGRRVGAANEDAQLAGAWRQQVGDLVEARQVEVAHGDVQAMWDAVGIG